MPGTMDSFRASGEVVAYSAKHGKHVIMTGPSVQNVLMVDLQANPFVVEICAPGIKLYEHSFLAKPNTHLRDCEVCMNKLEVKSTCVPSSTNPFPVRSRPHLLSSKKHSWQLCMRPEAFVSRPLSDAPNVTKICLIYSMAWYAPNPTC